MSKMLLEGYQNITDINAFAFWALAGLVFAACSLIKIATDSYFMTVIYLPFMAFGGLLSRYAFDRGFVNFLNDKDSNVILAETCGVVIAMILVTIVLRGLGAMSDRRHHQRRPRRGLTPAE